MLTDFAGRKKRPKEVALFTSKSGAEGTRTLDLLRDRQAL